MSYRFRAQKQNDANKLFFFCHDVASCASNVTTLLCDNSIVSSKQSKYIDISVALCDRDNVKGWQPELRGRKQKLVRQGKHQVHTLRNQNKVTDKTTQQRKKTTFLNEVCTFITRINPKLCHVIFYRILCDRAQIT